MIMAVDYHTQTVAVLLIAFPGEDWTWTSLKIKPGNPVTVKQNWKPRTSPSLIDITDGVLSTTERNSV